MKSLPAAQVATYFLPTSIETSELQRSRLNLAQSILPGHYLVHRHACGRTTIHFLLGRVDAVGIFIHRQTVHFFLNREILQLAEMVGVVLLEYRDRTAVASHINALESGIELYDVWAFRQGQKGYRLVRFQIKHRHQ